jgi:hypothetical protein
LVKILNSKAPVFAGAFDPFSYKKNFDEPIRKVLRESRGHLLSFKERK